MKTFKWVAGVALGLILAANPAFANVTHIVAFKFKANATSEQKADFAKRFFALQDVARRNGQRYIVSIAGGHQSSREELDAGTEQVFVVTFKTASDRDYFVGKPYRDEPDPAHGALMPLALSLVDTDAAGKQAIIVLDYEDTGGP